MKRFFSVFIILGLLMGCTGESTIGSRSNRFLSVTVGVEDITANSAVLKGKANIGSSASSDLSVGFQYSNVAGILPSNATTIEVTEAAADYSYSALITDLRAGTTYYFRSYVRQNGQDTYGETKSFTTLSTKNAFMIAGTSTLIAKDLTIRPGQEIYIYCCIYYSDGNSTYLNGDYSASSDDMGIVSCSSGFYDNKPCIVLKGMASGNTTVKLNYWLDGFHLYKTVNVKVQ